MVPTFATVDERCAACTMNGGTQNPCMSVSALARYESRWKRPCPFVALDPDNEDAAELFGLLASGSITYESHFADLLHQATPDGRIAMRRRLLHVLGHNSYREARREAEERMRREAEARERSRRRSP